MEFSVVGDRMGGVSELNDCIRVIESAPLEEVGVDAGMSKRTWLDRVSYGDGPGVVGTFGEAIATVDERVRAGACKARTGGRSNDVGDSCPRPRELVR